MKLKEWIAKYEQEAEEFILLPGFSIYYEPEKGFFCWRVFGNIFEVDHTCTNDGKWAYNTVNEVAKLFGCKFIRTATKRNPRAYKRLFKGSINFALSGIRPNGEMYWIFEKKVI